MIINSKRSKNDLSEFIIIRSDLHTAEKKTGKINGEVEMVFKMKQQQKQ